MLEQPKVMAGQAGIKASKEDEILNAPNYIDQLQKQKAFEKMQNVRQTAAKYTHQMPGINAENVSRGTVSNIPQATPEQSTALDEWMTHLQGIKTAHDYLVKTQPELKEAPDLDSEPHGYDASDKISMISAVMLGGENEIENIAARAVQVGSLISEKMHLAKAGGSDEFTNWYNRKLSRNKAFQEAQQAHPVMFELGKMVGGGMAISAAAGAAALATPELAGGAAIAGGVAATAKTAQLIKTALNVGTAKTLINAQKAGKAMMLAKTLGKGALIGETQYDPENNHYISQGVTGALINAAFHGGFNTIRALATPFGETIKRIAVEHNLNLPIYKFLEKTAAKLPFTGAGKVIQERAQQIAQKGEELASVLEGKGKTIVAGKDYSEYLAGEAHQTFLRNTERVNKINEGIAKRVGNKVIPNISSGQMASDVLAKEGIMPASVQDKTLLEFAKDLSTEKGNAFNYSTFDEIRKRIGERVGMEKSPGVKKRLGDLYYSIVNDQEKFLEQNNPKLLKSFNLQKKIHIEKVMPFKNGKFQAFRDDDFNSDKFIGKFLKPESPVTATELFDMLPVKKKTQAVVMAALSNQAMHEAEIEGIGFNPVKYVNSLLRLGKTNNVIFPEKQLKALKGYQELINIVGSISKEALNPEVAVHGLPSMPLTQGKIMNLLGIGGAEVGAHALGASYPMLIMATAAPIAFLRLTTSPAGQTLLRKVHSLAGKVVRKEFDSITAKMLDVIFSKVGKTAVIQEGAEIGRNL